MNNGFLSQEEIDALLNGTPMGDGKPENSEDESLNELLSDIGKDVLGEVGNISMGSASTALSQILGQKVNITTPRVSVTTLKTIREAFQTPNVVLDVTYTSGITGSNLLLMKITDAGIVANLMMGGDGNVEGIVELSEIEISAVSEAMNQMIGSAATAMATMFSREVNISPPISKIYHSNSENITNSIKDDEPIVQILFQLAVGDLIDSNIMQILPLDTAKKIISIMMGNEESASEPSETFLNPSVEEVAQTTESKSIEYASTQQTNAQSQNNYYYEESIPPSKPVNVREASFETLSPTNVYGQYNNIDLILDVPLQVSVELGRSKMNIKEVLELGNGSLIELDKLTEEPVEILINGKKIAYGEVVVVDENFGVRITSIVSNEERIKSLGK